MRKITAVGVGCVGLWFLVPGLLSVLGSPLAEPGDAAVPMFGSAALLGAALVVVSAVLWRGRPQPGA